ncbi:tetratricopeptide repeat protein [Streptomyces sp. NPDC049577]|uniref:tetratricopeptide repeat protein n=1 Tax=Streptomyces sp. NPDC049577 TaxID=3155153 RepID=UPI0034390227
MTESAQPGETVNNLISGGVYFGPVVQGRQISLTLPPSIRPALSGLPAAAPAFTGRDEELRRIRDSLDPDATEETAAPVTVVAGLAGVGKTELVLQAAHAAVERGWFPGGVLFRDLFGYDKPRSPGDETRHVPPGQALHGMLHALGVPGEHIPAGLQERAALYRSVLAAYAEQGRRILVVVDNVSTADQLRPLLPGDGTTRVLATSRHTLDVGARLHDLPVLRPRSSVDLVKGVLRRTRGTADTRVDDAPEEAARLAELCGHLPLALHIAAALLADTATQPVADLVRDLDEACSRLDRLTREERAVRAAFELSYRHLDEDHARLFRLLPLAPGPDLSTETADRLAGRRAQELLRDLARAHLVEPGTVWGRWRLHDLVRLYADERGVREDGDAAREEAVDRLLEHYIETCQHADRHLRALERIVDPDNRFGTQQDALAWLNGERTSLVAAVDLAARTSRRASTLSLSFALTEYLINWGHRPDEALATGDQGRAAAEALGDRAKEARMLNNMACAALMAKRHDEAIRLCTRAAGRFAGLGDEHSEAAVRNVLAVALSEAGRHEEAIDAGRRSLAIWDRLDAPYEKSAALNNLGLALKSTGRYPEAIDAFRQDMAICLSLGDLRGAAQTLTNLGTTLEETGQRAKALLALTEAAALLGEGNDPYGRAETLHNLSGVLCASGRTDEAVEASTEAVSVFEEAGDRRAMAKAVDGLGRALTAAGKAEEAAEAHFRAAALWGEIGELSDEAAAYGNAGMLLQQLGRTGEAVEALRHDLALCRRFTDRAAEAAALNNLALALHDAGHRDEATAMCAEAAELYGRLGDARRRAETLHNLRVMRRPRRWWRTRRG